MNQAELPTVLSCLFEEHKHMEALVCSLKNKAEKTGDLEAGDLYLMRDIVGYLHDYPDQIHHPTEELLFELLVKREPGQSGAVERLRTDHQAGALETKNLVDLLEGMIQDPKDSTEEQVRADCEQFAIHQSNHMNFESSVLFPAAIEALNEADWRQIESFFSTVDDPLFGGIVGNNHRLLYEYLIDPAGKVAGTMTVSELLSMERLMLAANVVEEGSLEWLSRLKTLGDDVIRESRTALKKAFPPDSVSGAVGTPFKYAAFVGKSVLGCSADLTRIYFGTAKDTLAVIIVGKGLVGQGLAGKGNVGSN